MATNLGPVEVLAIKFPGSTFNGRILDEVQSLVDRDIVNIVDGVLAHRNADGALTVAELDQPDLEPDAALLSALLADSRHDLISEDDIQQLTAGLEPGSSAAVLVFEHEWAKPVRDSIVESGGVLMANLRVPGPVVDEVLASLAEPSLDVSAS